MTNVVVFNHPKLPPKKERSPMCYWPPRHLPRAGEVYAIHLSLHTRSSISMILKKRDGGDIWQIILDAIDAGFLTRNHNVIGCSRDGKVTLRLLFSNWPPHGNQLSPLAYRYDLRDAQHRQFVREVIMPIALANKEAVLADPTCLERLVTFRPSNQQGTPRPVPTKPAPLQSTEYPVTMYGLQLWPRPDYATYSYIQMRAACRFFQDQLTLCEQSKSLSSPGSKAWAIRQSTRALQAYSDVQVLNLTDQIATAMEMNPNGKCSPPPMPLDLLW
jgi:hypothetical protein